MDPGYLIVISETDPAAREVASAWGTPASTGWSIDGSPIRRLSPQALVLRRPVSHIRDEHLDERLPQELRSPPIPLVFPSIHRSGRGVPALTVHAIGNPGRNAELGGRPFTLVPAAPRLMTNALRRISEVGGPEQLPATFEATHHGPELLSPAFFAEIGYGEAPGPPAAAVALWARVLPDLVEDPADRIVLAVGGGHYAPHFTELALSRRWAFGHILSKHVLPEVGADMARMALERTPGAEGILFARAQDAHSEIWSSLAPRLRDGDAPQRPA